MSSRLRIILASAAAVAVVPAGAWAALSVTPAGADPGTIYGCVHTSASRSIIDVGSAPVNCPAGTDSISWAGTIGIPAPSPSATPTPSPTVSPAPSPTVSPTPSPSPSPSPTGTGPACKIGVGGTCGPYVDAGIAMSHGFDTYVLNQSISPQPGTTQAATVTGPGNWSMVADDRPYGFTGVQTFDAVQQLTNDWNGSGWGNCGSCTDTPLASLTSLTVTYSESSPRDAGSVYEFAPDVWNDNYSSDVMFWADTWGRPLPSTGAQTQLGTAVIDGQSWAVWRYGGVGSEIIFALCAPGGCGDGTVTSDYAQQTSGTINILAGFQWLVAHGVMSSLGSLSQLNTGWEICSSDNQVFSVTQYGIQATT